MPARLAGLPQFWLLPFALAGWLIGGLRPVALPGWPGALLIAAGILLMLWAAAAMRRARTTVWPGQVPSRLVTWGPFRLSRNPIYLGDLLVLAGLMLLLDRPLGLVAVPGFALWLSHRFIRSEEAAAQAAFGAEFRHYRAMVRRWL